MKSAMPFSGAAWEVFGGDWMVDFWTWKFGCFFFVSVVFLMEVSIYIYIIIYNLQLHLSLLFQGW